MRKRQSIQRMPALAPRMTKKKPSQVFFNSISSLSMTESHLIMRPKYLNVKSKTLAVSLIYANNSYITRKNIKYQKPRAKVSTKKKKSLKRILKFQSTEKEKYSTFNAKFKI